MIENLTLAVDGAGFPVVRWTEIRSDASHLGGRVQIECRIAKAPGTGELLFAARGSARHRRFEEARPWQHLRGFSVKRSDELYRTSLERTLTQHLPDKSLLSRILVAPHEQVLLADFAGDVRMHLNAVDAPTVDFERVHLLLTEMFVTRQRALVMEYCDEAFYWPPGDGRVETYHPGRTIAPLAVTTKAIADRVMATVLAAAFAALVAWMAFRLFANK